MSWLHPVNNHQALLDSIEHWWQNLDMLILNYLSGGELDADIRIYSRDCALCGLYIEVQGCCEGCPVRLDTGLGGCCGTPWKDVEHWYRCKKDVEGRVMSRGSKVESGSRRSDYCRGYKVVSAELEYLILLSERGF